MEHFGCFCFDEMTKTATRERANKIFNVLTFLLRFFCSCDMRSATVSTPQLTARILDFCYFSQGLFSSADVSISKSTTRMRKKSERAQIWRLIKSAMNFSWQSRINSERKFTICICVLSQRFFCDMWHDTIYGSEIQTATQWRHSSTQQSEKCETSAEFLSLTCSLLQILFCHEIRTIEG